MGDKFQVMGALSKGEYEALKADIAENGVVVAVVEDAGGRVIDGHHRVRAWTELRDEGHDTPDYPRDVRSDLKTDAEKRELAWRLNMQRRHLNRAQKQDMIARKLKESPDWSDNRVAKLLGVSWVTVHMAREELEGTSQIERLERLVGSDGKARPRNDPRTEEEKEEFRKERREVEEKRKAANLCEAIHLNPDRSDKEIAERLESDEAEVARQRLRVDEFAAVRGPQRGYDIVYRGLTALRRATGYRRPRSPLREYFSPRIEIEPVFDLEEIADKLALLYIRNEMPGKRLDSSLPESAAERVRDRVRADQAAAALLAELVAALERKVENKIALVEGLPEHISQLEEDLKRLYEEGEDSG
jgi:ParB-like chromosome segregation protein Spo0J